MHISFYKIKVVSHNVVTAKLQLEPTLMNYYNFGKINIISLNITLSSNLKTTAYRNIHIKL